jgi:hypothetical protein
MWKCGNGFSKRERILKCVNTSLKKASATKDPKDMLADTMTKSNLGKFS